MFMNKSIKFDGVNRPAIRRPLLQKAGQGYTDNHRPPAWTLLWQLHKHLLKIWSVNAEPLGIPADPDRLVIGIIGLRFDIHRYGKRLGLLRHLGIERAERGMQRVIQRRRVD